jgi:PAS domain S-box-containing protein
MAPDFDMFPSSAKLPDLRMRFSLPYMAARSGRPSGGYETAGLQSRIAALERQLGEVQQREREWSSTFDLASIGLHRLSAAGIILWVNQAELDLLGYRSEEYVGHHVAEFHADPQTIGDIPGRFARREILRNCEATMRARDGSPRHVLISSTAVCDGECLLHTMCVTRDITEAKRIDEELRTSQERFSRFVQYLPGAAWMKDLEGRYIYVNETGERIFRRKLDDLRGRRDDEIFFPAGIAAQFQENDRKALAGHYLEVIEALRKTVCISRWSPGSRFPVPAGAPFCSGELVSILPSRKRSSRH